MSKVHTRVKRKLKTYTTKGRNRKPRQKTFSSEAAAKKHAEAKGIKEFSLLNLKSGNASQQKIRIVSR